MFCPRCGQERISEETRYCSRCGFLLTGIESLLATGGAPAVEHHPSSQGLSPRSRGIRKGLFLFLLTFVIAPVVGLISEFGLGIAPWPVGLVIFGLGFGGLVRIAYAMMFESKVAALQQSDTAGHDPKLNGRTSQDLLGAPSAQAEFDGTSFRLETNELSPMSITDDTTKLLKKERKRGI